MTQGLQTSIGIDLHQLTKGGLRVANGHLEERRARCAGARAVKLAGPHLMAEPSPDDLQEGLADRMRTAAAMP